MPIGVPRIIYCWGEELPPQWTDIYNFIFRRRMVFLMQYLDDELCNQICGLLINIHMEDRSKELEKKEIEKSGIFKSAGKSSGSNLPSSLLPPGALQGEDFSSSSVAGQGSGGVSQQMKAQSLGKKLKKDKSMEDLLSSYSNSTYEEDLAIDENYTLEQYTLQKITLEWLNWNAQFFDFSDEPYLFHLAEILSKDFSKDDTQLSLLKEPPMSSAHGDKNNFFGITGRGVSSESNDFGTFSLSNNIGETPSLFGSNTHKRAKDVYSPFRSIVNLANLISKDKNFSIQNLLPNAIKGKKNTKDLLQQWPYHKLQKKPGLAKLIGVLSSKEFLNKNATPAFAARREEEQENGFQTQVPSKALGQRNLRREYTMDNAYKNQTSSDLNKLSTSKTSHKGALSYLDFDSANGNQSYLFADSKNSERSGRTGRNDYARKQAKKALQEEESKKVFVIINSFGGSVGNGITVHDALQFIKAGSLTLGLGVAASAASLVLAGGTISERYVTEGCHTMCHQPESSINGQASDIWIDSQEIMKIRLDVAEIYSLSAHRPRHKILRDLDRDFYLTATETIHYGLADEIATNEVMHEIIEMTSKVWDYHDGKQQRLLESRDSASSGIGFETQN